MTRFILSACVVAFAFSVATAADPRDASEILKEYDAVKLPAFDASKRDDQAFIRSYLADREKALAKQTELAEELYRAHPQHERAVKLMVARWNNMRTQPDKALDEMESFLKENPDSPSRKDVMYTRAMLAISGMRNAAAKSEPYVSEFISAFPADERGASLLSMLAMRESNQAKRVDIYRRIMASYPSSRAAKMAQGSIRQSDELGKPFELTFEDAITGKTVSLKGLEGKVVVIDFWATWCGPCIAEMPKMKDLYARHKDEGVEFIGISLDAPGEGLEKLKKYVEENGIQWPQYYQGNGWDSEFSQAWGINSIPALFVVDAEGKLHSTQARGKLESLIPELLKKRDDKS